MELTELEARLIGCLLEKEVTTPEQYPLSLNALTLACNQKSSREPVMALSETQVQAGLDGLNKKRLISEQSGFGSRVIKYKHRFCNTEFSELQLSTAETAILCLLLLRGPQTPGELRTRSQRLHDFSDVAEVETWLQKMSTATMPLVAQLEKEPNKREHRFAQLFTEAQPNLARGTPANTASLSRVEAPQPDAQANTQDSLIRIKQLEGRVSELELKLAALMTRLND